MNRTIKVAQQGNFRIKTILDENTRVTTCEVASVDLFGDRLVIGRGKARWNPIDFFDAEIGEGIALGRAMAKFGKNLATFWQAQSGSVGEHNRRLKEQREIQEIGEVFYLQAARRNPRLPKPESPERLAWIEEQKKKAKNYKPSLLERIQDVPQVQNISQEQDEPSYDELSRWPVEASDVILDNLDSVIETNRAKLENPPNQGGQHK